MGRRDDGGIAGFLDAGAKACWILALGLAAGCGPLSTRIVTETPPPSSPQLYPVRELADALARPLVDGGQNVGIVIGVLTPDGRKHVLSYGRTSRAPGAPAPDGDTVFAIGSVTKAFLQDLYRQLAADGAIDPRDNLVDVLGEPALVFSPAARRITFHQLANHVSGLPRQPIRFEMFRSLVNYSFTGENIYRHLDKSAVYAYLREFKPKASDHYTRYSNIGMGLLGHLIETRTGERLGALLAERVFRPLGLADTGYRLSADQRRRLAQGHAGASPYFMARNAPIGLWEMSDVLLGAAGLYSTANDLLRFAQHQLRQPDAIVDAVVPGPLFGGDRIERVSYGWAVDEFEEPVATVVFMHGMIGGFSAYLGLEKSKRFAVVVLCNNFDWDDRVGHSLLLALSREQTVVAGMPAAR